jgi:dTDP-4-dehydrorhamnose reductase
MKPRILLIGKTGQIGRDLNSLLPSLGDFTAVDRSQLDLSRAQQISETVRSIRPTLIVNAAAYTAVDRAESEHAAAHAVNAEAPGILAEEAAKCGALLVHYSTDYVFDGTSRTAYVEGDAPNPLNVYGKTKLEGERAIQRSGVAHLIFRTQWIYARDGKNFLRTVLRLATERQELRIVGDQIGSPTLSREVASATVGILRGIFDNQQNGAAAAFSGVYHMTAAGETTWCGFANAILDEATSEAADHSWISEVTAQRPLLARCAIAIPTSEYPTPARRPAFSLLSNALLTRTFGIQLPHWRTQLRSALGRLATTNS